MALKAGYVGVKRWLYEKLQATTAKNVQDIADIWTNNNTTGSKNMACNSASSTTDSGIHYTVASDGAVSVYGLATADTHLDINTGHVVPCNGKKLICSGCPSGGSTSSYSLQVRLSNPNGSWYGARNDTGSGYTLTKTEAEANVNILLRINIANGTNIPEASPKVFKPMIYDPINPNSDYVPYAKTNQQLTADIATDAATLDAHKTTINGIISAATGAADFAAFKTAMAALSPLTRSVAPENREVIEEEPEPVTKTTRSTKKTATIKEGE